MIIVALLKCSTGWARTTTTANRSLVASGLANASQLWGKETRLWRLGFIYIYIYYGFRVPGLWLAVLWAVG